MKIIGPTTYYNWLLSASHITSTISLPLAGGLSDIFGRRWFMIFGGTIQTVAAIVALAAQDIPTMIAASLIAGLGSGALMLSLAAVAELVPNNKRGVVQACLDLVGLPWNVFGALTGLFSWVIWKRAILTFDRWSYGRTYCSVANQPYVLLM